MTARLASVVSLDGARARRRAAQPSARPGAILSALPGSVLLDFGDGSGLELSAEHARAWAERLVAMADVADGLLPKGGPRAL